MNFEWDIEKQEKNISKHVIDCVQASQIFKSPVLQRKDNRKDYGEERLIALGKFDGVVLCVVYTLRDNKLRIISAWKASKNDRKTYERACGQL